jgi:hypothetical protein
MLQPSKSSPQFWPEAAQLVLGAQGAAPQTPAIPLPPQRAGALQEPQ